MSHQLMMHHLCLRNAQGVHPMYVLLNLHCQGACRRVLLGGDISAASRACRLSSAIISLALSICCWTAGSSMTGLAAAGMLALQGEEMCSLHSRAPSCTSSHWLPCSPPSAFSSRSKSTCMGCTCRRWHAVFSQVHTGNGNKERGRALRYAFHAHHVVIVAYLALSLCSLQLLA